MNMSPLGPLSQVTAGPGGPAVVGAALVRGVGDQVVAAAAVAVVAPDVAQVEPVADLVGRGAAEVERRRRRAGGAEAGVQDDDAVGLRRAAGELGVAEQAAAELADPQVEVAVGGPRVGAAGRGGLDGVVGRRTPPPTVCVRVTSASTNSTRESATMPDHTAGTDAASALVARKSWLRTSIWLAICSSETFCAGWFQTTWTTTGMVTTVSSCGGPSRPMSNVWFSMASRARAYAGSLSSSRRCTGIVPHQSASWRHVCHARHSRLP